MEYLVIGMKGSRYSRSPILGRVWDPESHCCAALIFLAFWIIPADRQFSSGPIILMVIIVDPGLPT